MDANTIQETLEELFELDDEDLVCASGGAGALVDPNG